MQVERSRENLKQCQCMNCPSYTTGCKIKCVPDNIIKLMDGLNDTDHFECMFCAFEQSNCIKTYKGCLCEICPIHKKYALKQESYCLK